MDRNTARLMRDEVIDALQAVAKRHGMTVIFKGGTFSTTSYAPKVEFQEGNHDAREWSTLAPLLGLTDADHGARFTSGGKTFVAFAINLKAPRFPILAQLEGTDKTFKFSLESFKRAARVAA